MVLQVFSFEEAARDILSYVFFTGHLKVVASSWIVPTSDKGDSVGMLDALPHEVRSWGIVGSISKKAVRCA
jgi:hypothetical protein